MIATGAFVAATPAIAAPSSGESYVPLSAIAPTASSTDENAVYNSWHFDPSHAQLDATTQEANGIRVGAQKKVLVRVGNGQNTLGKDDVANGNAQITDLAASMNVVSTNPDRVFLQIPVFYWVPDAPVVELQASAEAPAESTNPAETSDPAELAEPADETSTEDPAAPTEDEAETNGAPDAGATALNADPTYSQKYTTIRTTLAGGWTLSGSNLPGGLVSSQNYELGQIVDGLGVTARPIAAGLFVETKAEDVTVTSFSANGITTRFHAEPTVNTPAPAAPAQSETELPGELENVQNTGQTGNTVTLQIPGAVEGQWYFIWAYSEPTALGWFQAGPGGTIVIDLSALPEGIHTLAALDASGALVGWVGGIEVQAVDNGTGGTDGPGTGGPGTGEPGTGRPGTGPGTSVTPTTAVVSHGVKTLANTGSGSLELAGALGLLALGSAAAVLGLRRRTQHS